MSIERILAAIIRYYAVNRRAGHTFTMRTGTENNDCLVVCATYDSGRTISEKNPIPLDGFEERTMGCSKPLAFDNYAIQSLCIAASDRIESLRRENAALREALRPFAERANDYVDDAQDNWSPTPGGRYNLGTLRKARTLLTGAKHD